MLIPILSYITVIPFPIPHTYRPDLPPHHLLPLLPKSAAVAATTTQMEGWVVVTTIISALQLLPPPPPLPLPLTLELSPSGYRLSPSASSSTLTPRLVRTQEVVVVVASVGKVEIGLGVWPEVRYRRRTVRRRSTHWTWRGRSFLEETPCWRCSRDCRPTKRACKCSFRCARE